MHNAYKVFVCGVVCWLAITPLFAQTATLPSGTPLKVELTKRVRIRRGVAVFGHLVQPVYLLDHRLLPAGAAVTGHIRTVHAGPRSLLVLVRQVGV